MSDEPPRPLYPHSKRSLEEAEQGRYFYKNGVLRNKAGIIDPEEYRAFEYREFVEQSLTRPHMESFTYGEMQGVHRHLFGNVWEWAGETRRFTTRRADAMFARPEFIEPETQKLLNELNAEDNLAGVDRKRFVERAAHYVNEFNAIHPFVDGNGRVTRAFLEDMAVKADLRLDISKIEPVRWNEAAREGFLDDAGPMRECIDTALVEKVRERQGELQDERGSDNRETRNIRVERSHDRGRRR